MPLLAGCPSSNSEFCEDNCNAGEHIYFCAGAGSGNNRVCADSLQSATLACHPHQVDGGVSCDGNADSGADGGSGGAGGSGADGGSSGAAFPNWDPDDYVRFNRATGRVEVDAALIDDIASNGYVLISEDSARLEATAGDYYKLVSVARDDLAYHLGLRDEDVITSANGIHLKDLDDYAQAIVQLRNVSLLTLVIKRGLTTVTIEIDIA